MGISQRFAKGMGLRRSLQRLSECSHEVIINGHCPMCLAEPPALWGALQERYSLLAMLDPAQMLSRPVTLPRQHVIRLACSRVIPTPPSFFQSALGALCCLLLIPI